MFALKMEQQKVKRLRKKTVKLRELIERSNEQCATIEETALNDAITLLPLVQQEAVRHCFKAAKISHARSRRYSTEWVYECLLMRIKSSKLYDHLRSYNILPLPCKDTLDKYIRRLNSTFGFQKVIFDCLLKKGSEMTIEDKRGTLLVDEMSLSEAISLDRRTLNFNGFVNLGDYTPSNQQNVRGDHALVFMFQPFRGNSVQVLGCFLSKNSVTSQVLHKLILECIILIGRSGFYINVVTMDGAQWNRGVWTIFGINENNLSCEHPYFPGERLWMVSDFPHLIKCFRTGIMNVQMFMTHKGMIKRKHFEALLNCEGYPRPNLKVAYTLTPAHVHPKRYQKMNVLLAFQLFSKRVSAAMEIYKDKCPDLHDSEATIELINIMDDLIQAMMSRIPRDALQPSNNCRHNQAIQQFLNYLLNWQNEARSRKVVFPISNSTLTGLKVTLKSTLELVNFLIKESHYKYLMTVRINQDKLERFFGIMRNACGINDHPDPVMFTQVFRLLCTYSLVKPPKNSNVGGTELLKTLVDSKEAIKADEITKNNVLEKLDALIELRYQEKGEENNHDPSFTASSNHSHNQSECSQPSHLSSHDYDVAVPSEEVQAYIAGYVARKVLRLTRCANCVDRLTTSDPCNRDKAITLLNRFDGLLYPSEELFQLTKKLEEIILDIVGKLCIHENTLIQIFERVTEEKSIIFVGCPEHEKEITKNVIHFYLIMRAHFLADSFNENNNSKKIKTKTNRKNAKL